MVKINFENLFRIYDKKKSNRHFPEYCFDESDFVINLENETRIYFNSKYVDRWNQFDSHIYRVNCINEYMSIIVFVDIEKKEYSIYCG